MQAGERLAILGESGSGKSTLALAVAGHLPSNAELRGRIMWPRLKAAPAHGRDIGFVFQDPAGSLDPLMRIGKQVEEVLVANHVRQPESAAERVSELLAQVQLPDPVSIARAYPHQLSGGQKQRVAIACAIAGEPDLLIADEPTSALDTIVQAEILALLCDLVRAHSMSMMLITHDIAVAAQNADRIAILQSGRLVEIGYAAQMVQHPNTAYARTLVSTHIGLDAAIRTPPFAASAAPGSPP
jgi:peptide/nickel transport system ATP-binding protein